jgi:methyltransferase (TIGR00027 family)
MARFRFFSSQLAGAAETFDQFLLLGVGFDTRALWLPALQDSNATIFEVDLPETMAEKIAVLRDHGIEYPTRVVPIGADLTAPNLPDVLDAHAYRRDVPTCVLLEGVVFLLPAAVNEALFRPDYLGLASNSRVAFDVWPNARVNLSNADFGRTFFQSFPFPDDPAGLGGKLRELGYRDVKIEFVDDLAARLWPSERSASPGEDYMLVEATVGG